MSEYIFMWLYWSLWTALVFVTGFGVGRWFERLKNAGLIKEEEE